MLQHDSDVMGGQQRALNGHVQKLLRVYIEIYRHRNYEDAKSDHCAAR